MKLKRLLGTFTSPIWSDFEKYIEASFFNCTDLERKLFFILKRSFARPNAKFPSKEKVWQQLYPEKPVCKTDYMNNLYSRLYNLALYFLSIQYYRHNTTQQGLDILLFLKGNKTLQADFEAQIKKMKKKLPDTQQRISNDWLTHYRLAKHEDSLWVHNKKKERDLPAVIAPLDKYYLLEKLKNYCLQLNQANGLYKTLHLPDLEHFRTYLKQFQLDGLPLLQTYAALLEVLIDDDNPPLFVAFLDTIAQTKFASHLPMSQKSNIYRFLLNLFYKKISLGNYAYRKQALQIQEILLTQRFVFRKNGTLRFKQFKNIVILALQAGELERARKIMDDYLPYIAPKYQEDMRLHNEGALCFYSVQWQKTNAIEGYKKAIAYFNEIGYSDEFFTIGKNHLLLKCYYELYFLYEQSTSTWRIAADYEDLFSKRIIAFKTLLKRKTALIKEVRQMYRQMIDFMETLSKSTTKPALLNLKNDVMACHGITSKEWILKKIEEAIHRIGK